MLSLRLMELEAEGILRRVVIPETPVRIEYRLTDKGRALAPPVAALVAWTDAWIAPESVGLTAANGPYVMAPQPARRYA